MAVNIRYFVLFCQVVHVQHPQGRNGGDGYHKLAAHYGWALTQVFEVLFPAGQLPAPPRRVVVLEEDLEVRRARAKRAGRIPKL